MSDPVEERFDKVEQGTLLNAEAIGRIGHETRDLHGCFVSLSADVRALERNYARMDEREHATTATVGEIKAVGNTLTGQLHAIILRIEQMQRSWQNQILTLSVTAIGILGIAVWQWVIKL